MSKYEDDKREPLNDMERGEVEDDRPTNDFSNHAFTIAWRKATYVWSTVLLGFAMFVTLYGIAKQWNNPPWSQTKSHPVLEIFFFFFMCFWIALLEGCQISLVGLQGIDIERYKHSHPRAYAALAVCHRGPNVERFLVGRQFLLLFNGFLLSKVAGAGTEDFYIGDWEWSSEASQFFWVNSVLLMILIAAFAQLVSQLLAAQKMLGFLNLPFFALYSVVYPCLLVESVGMTHSSYLFKDFLVHIARIPKSEADPAKAQNKNFVYYAKCIFSVCLVIFSFVFIVKGVAMKQTNATEGVGWSKLPGWAAVILSLFFIYLIACSEGMQVSLLAMATIPSHEYKKRAPLAYRTAQLAYSGRNMQAFLVGRQFTVAMMIVLLSRVTSYAGSDGELIGSGEDWGMGEGFNAGLLQTGFLGAILVVNVGQLASQVAASIFPVACLNNYVMHFLLRIMLFIEFSGIVNSCWVLTWALDAVTALPNDPFDGDEDAKTPGQGIVDRKKSMGIPQQKGVTPFDLHQPESEYHIEYTYKVSYI